MNLKRFFSVSAISVLATAAGITLAEVYVGPIDTPENYNVKPPVNVSSAGQVKLGSLALPNLVIGTDMIFKGDANAGGSKVGIGNADPSKKLDVTGDINFTGDLYKNGALFKSGKFVDGDDTNDAVYTIGNVGIGMTSPSEKLDVGGAIKGKNKIVIANEDDNNYGYLEGIRNDGLRGFFLGYGNGNSVVDLKLDNASRLDITGGDVYMGEKLGIGIITPEEKLHVDGIIKASEGDMVGWYDADGREFSYSDGSSHYYWLKVARLGSSSGSSLILDFKTKGDKNYPKYGEFRLVASAYSSSAVSLMLDRIVGDSNVSLQAVVDENRYIWVKSNIAWSRDFRYKVLSNNMSIIYHDNVDRVESKPTNSSEIVFENTGIRTTVDDIGTTTHKYINDIFVKSDGKVGIGTTSPSEKLDVVGNVRADAYLYSSDINLKKDINKLENYRDILKINAVRFNWKKNGKADVGIIAQEVQKYFPEFVHKSGDHLAVDYPKLSVPMLNLLQEQDERLSKQEKEIQELKEAIKKLQNK